MDKHRLIEGIYHRTNSINSRLVHVAQFVSDLDPYAFDYIYHAPVIVLPGVDFSVTRPRQRDRLFNMYNKALDGHPKLNEVLTRLGIAPQLRVLYGAPLAPVFWNSLQHLTKVNPSTLAQSIPRRIGGQSTWLHCLFAWVDQMRHHCRPPATHLEWIVRELGRRPGRYSRSNIVTVADLAAVPDPGPGDTPLWTHMRFNPAWTYEQALRVSDLWHAELRERTNTAAHRRQFDIGFNDKVDYGDMPDLWVSTATSVHPAYEFHALRSGADLHAEGAAMHNCVASYFGVIHRKQSYIYSIRHDGKRVATVEIDRMANIEQASVEQASPELARLAVRLGTVRQLKGPCNRAVPHLMPVVAEFINKAKKGVKP